MRRMAMAGLLAAATALPAAAQQAGRYDVEGRSPDGSAYSGVAELRQTGPDTWRLAWSIGADAGEGVGLVLPDRRTLAIGYVFAGQTGAIAYSIEPGGVLRGIWTMGAGGGLGVEVLMPSRP